MRYLHMYKGQYNECEAGKIKYINAKLEEFGFGDGWLEERINRILGKLDIAESNAKIAIRFNRVGTEVPEAGDEVRVDGYGCIIHDGVNNDYKKVLVEYTQWYKVLYYGPRWIQIEVQPGEKIEMAKNSVLEVRKVAPKLGQFKHGGCGGITEVFRSTGWAISATRAPERRKTNDRLSKGLQVVAKNVYAGLESRNTLNCMLSLARTNETITNFTPYRSNFNGSDRRKKV